MAYNIRQAKNTENENSLKCIQDDTRVPEDVNASQTRKKSYQPGSTHQREQSQVDAECLFSAYFTN